MVTGLLCAGALGLNPPTMMTSGFVHVADPTAPGWSAGGAGRPGGGAVVSPPAGVDRVWIMHLITEMLAEQEKRHLAELRRERQAREGMQAQIDDLAARANNSCACDGQVANLTSSWRQLQSQGPNSQGDLVRIFKRTLTSSSSSNGGHRRLRVLVEVDCSPDGVKRLTDALNTECCDEPRPRTARVAPSRPATPIVRTSSSHCGSHARTSSVHLLNPLEPRRRCATPRSQAHTPLASS